jgi:flagellin
LSSINTNRSALQALQALNASARKVADAQSRVSTGLAVAGPKDNAAVYGIAQNMRAEAGGLRAVQDSLARGGGILDVAASAAATISELLVELKGRAVAYTEAALDPASRLAIKNDILALVRQIDKTADAAEFGGVNLLKPVTEPPIALPIPAAGPQPNLAHAALVDGRPGLINFTYAWYNTSPVPAPNVNISGTVNTHAAAHGVNPAYGQTTTFSTGLPYGDWEDFSVTTPSMVTFTANATPFPTPTPPTPPPPAIYGVELLSMTHTPFRTAEQILSSATGETVRLTYRPMTAEWLGLGGLGAASPQAVLNRIDAALTQAMSHAGRIGSEQNLVSTLQRQITERQGAVDAGVGNLVDADMGRESAKLQAAQVQQQLAAQSLAISNAAPQWLLKLFSS